VLDVFLPMMISLFFMHECAIWEMLLRVCKHCNKCFALIEHRTQNTTTELHITRDMP